MKNDRLYASAVVEALGSYSNDFSLKVYDTVTSTNTLVKEAAEAGAPGMTVFIASSQTAGRGRLGRSFLSPSESGLYMSLLLRPEAGTADTGTLRAEPENALRITTAAAVAVCRAIEKETGASAGIKWVNDIIINRKKVCGILTEAAFDSTGKLEYAVLGIGINVYQPDGGFPPELKSVAGSVCIDCVPGLRARIAAGVLREFTDIYLKAKDKLYMEEYIRRSVIIGREVRVIRLPAASEATESAVVLGIDGECKLLVRFSDGREETLSSGEISVKL